MRTLLPRRPTALQSRLQSGLKLSRHFFTTWWLKRGAMANAQGTIIGRWVASLNRSLLYKGISVQIILILLETCKTMRSVSRLPIFLRF